MLNQVILIILANPYIHILAHPFGRLLNGRGPVEMDFEKVLRMIKDSGCFIEINAQPDRLDLSDVNARIAREMGVGLVINTDAHSTNGLGLMKWGVAQARRAWLSADDVLNTRPWESIRKLLQERSL